jgi:ABC-type Zn uptake system ZnuABC Zn-binding protein ZnuA
MAELNMWEKAMGWRKRQMVEAQVDDVYVSPSQRNKVLEEVAREFDKMHALGDTAASFATYVRNMKNNAKT